MQKSAVSNTFQDVNVQSSPNKKKIYNHEISFN